MSLHRALGLVAALALLLGAASGAGAGPATEQLRGFFTQASQVLEDPTTEGKLAERLTAIRRLVHQAFDFRRAAELALGPAWAPRTLAEQEEFVRLFGALLERAYILGMASRTGMDNGVKVNYLGESPEGEFVTVRTTVVTRDGGVTTYAYRMIERGPGWAVVDVVIDGLSVLANYRSQFTRVLDTASFSELLGRMQAKVNSSDIWTASLDEAPRTAAALPHGPAVAPLPMPATSQTLVLQPAAPRSAEPRPTPQRVAVAETTVAMPPAAITPREALTRPVKAAVATLTSYWVQVGAFAKVETARRLAARLREWRLPVHTAPLAVAENAPTTVPLARVRVGPFPDRAQAEAALRDLRARGFTPFIADR
jgi:phospholipid transport system substrate-binding protein